MARVGSCSMDKEVYSPFKNVSIILKVGSWSFKGIIILLIYFLNCQKVLFTKK